MSRDLISYFKVVMLSVFCGALAVFFLQFLGVGFDLRINIAVGIVTGVFLGSMGWLGASILMVVLAMIIGPSLHPRDMLFGLLACGVQLLMALLVMGLKEVIQKRRFPLNEGV